MKYAGVLCAFLAASDAALSSRHLLADSGNSRTVGVASTNSAGGDFNEGRTSTGQGGGDSTNADCDSAGDALEETGAATNSAQIFAVLAGPGGLFVGTQVENDSCWSMQRSVSAATPMQGRNFAPDDLRVARPKDEGGMGETGVQGASAAGTDIVELQVLLGEYWGTQYCFASSITVETAWEGHPADQNVGITGVGVTVMSAATNGVSVLGNTGISAGNIDALYGYMAGRREGNYDSSKTEAMDYDRYMMEQEYGSVYDDWMMDLGGDFGFSTMDSMGKRRRTNALESGRAVGGKASDAHGDEAVQVQYPDRIVVIKTNGGAGDSRDGGDFCLGHYISWKTAMGFFAEVHSVKDQDGDGELITEIYVTVSSRYHTAGVAAAYLQLVGDEPELHQPWFIEYYKISDSFGDVFSDAGYTMMDGMHPDDFHADMGSGRFSVNSGTDLCTMVWNGIRHEAGRFNAAPVAGAYSAYQSTTSCIWDKDAINDGLAFFSGAGISTTSYCQFGEGSCGTWNALMSAFGQYTIGFHLGHGFEEMLSEPLIDKYAFDAIGSGRSGSDCPGVFIALACYTGGVVCPDKTLCPNHKVLSEYVTTNNNGHWTRGNGAAAWYGSSGASAWDPPIAMISVLSAVWAESQTRNGNLHETSGRKTAGAAIAVAASVTVNQYSCLGGSCEGEDRGGGMTAIQYVLNGDGALFVSAVAGSGSLSGSPFVSGDTVGISLSGNNGERATCVYSGDGNKSPPLVGVTSSSGQAKMAGAHSVSSFGGNTVFLCHGYGLRSRSWVNNMNCGGFRNDGSYSNNQVHVCDITGAMGGGPKCNDAAKNMGLGSGGWGEGCGGSLEYDLYEWLSGDIYDNFGGGDGKISEDMISEHFGGGGFAPGMLMSGRKG